jgi:hypothetical protein
VIPTLYSDDEPKLLLSVTIGAAKPVVRPPPTYEQLKQLEAALLAGPHVDPETLTHHHFAHGVYGREMRIPAGMIVVGKIHRYSTLNILAQGSISVTTPEGQKVITAPAIFTSPPGMKKVALALTDCVFLNGHPSFETDLEALEREFIVPEPKPAIGKDKERLCLGES